MSRSDTHPENNVFALDRRGAGTSQQLNKIERYWNEVRGKRLVPSRCEIDPRGMQGVLGHTFILERIAGGLARFRIAGSHLGELTGLELRQMPISALFLPGSREILAEALQSVFDDPSATRLTLHSPKGLGRAELKGELLLLPLRSDLGDIDRVLGGIWLEGDIGRTPRRFEIDGQSRRSLVGYAGPAMQDALGNPQISDLPTRKKSMPRPTQTTQDDTPYRSRPKRPQARAQASHLQLVVSND